MNSFRIHKREKNPPFKPSLKVMILYTKKCHNNQINNVQILAIIRDCIRGDIFIIIEKEIAKSLFVRGGQDKNVKIVY